MRPRIVTGVEPVEPVAEPLLFGGYPLWLVVLVGGLALAAACWLVARTFRVLAMVFAVGVVGFAGWLAWQHVFG